MSGSPVQTPESVLRAYFRAKDGNRPHFMRSVFCKEATLQVRVNTETISFPELTHGVAAITDVLVRRFAQTYENVYSFYLAHPPRVAAQFSCDWLVGMSQKEGGHVRVGCGRYDWSFHEKPPCLASRLVITIEAMQILPPDQLDSVLGWLQCLSYPWSSAAEVLAVAPAISALSPVTQYIGRHCA